MALGLSLLLACADADRDALDPSGGELAQGDLPRNAGSDGGSAATLADASSDAALAPALGDGGSASVPSAPSSNPPAPASVVPPRPGPASDTPEDACAALTYERFGKAFLSRYCVGCHGGSSAVAGVRLDSVEALRSQSDDVARLTTSGLMPRGNLKPSAAEREQLERWIACGAE